MTGKKGVVWGGEKGGNKSGKEVTIESKGQDGGQPQSQMPGSRWEKGKWGGGRGTGTARGAGMRYTSTGMGEAAKVKLLDFLIACPCAAGQKMNQNDCPVIRFLTWKIKTSL